MKNTLKTAMIASCALALAACGPQPEPRPNLILKTDSAALVANASANCLKILPDGYEYLGLKSVGDNYVTCRSNRVLGGAILDAVFGGGKGNEQTLTLVFGKTSAGYATVIISSSPKDITIEQQMEAMLRTQFEEIKQP